VTGELAGRLGDRLELCKVQMDILAQVDKRLAAMDEGAEEGPETDASKVTEYTELRVALGTQLFDLDFLYKQCASKHRMWEICLLILQVEGTPRERKEVIGHLWRNIICTEINEHRGNWYAHVQGTVTRLYRCYQTNPLMFPLEPIVTVLEQMHARLAATGRLRPASLQPSDREPEQADFAVGCLLEAGVPLAALAQAYEPLVTSDQLSPEEKVGCVTPSLFFTTR
jgi:hypothetical protein